jgi:hypothetical protein
VGLPPSVCNLFLRVPDSFRLPGARYDTARKIKDNQDAYCSKALKGKWKGLGDFPEDLQWEALVDVLRGRVKVVNRQIFRDSKESLMHQIRCTIIAMKL